MIEEREEAYLLEISSRSNVIKNPKKVFDDYYRENSNKQGLGTGLSLVKQICDEEDIRVSLHSDLNLTTFSYYFKKEEA